jgi:hypothetical protein
MKRLSRLGAIAGLLMMMAPVCQGAANLNMSKSNIYRLTYPADLTSAAQANAMLAELDQLGTAGDAKLKQWLPANFKQYGIETKRVRKIVILPAGRAGKQ